MTKTEYIWALALRSARLGDPSKLAALVEAEAPPSEEVRKALARWIRAGHPGKPPRKNAPQPPLERRVQLAGDLVRWITRHMTKQELQEWVSSRSSPNRFPGFRAQVRAPSKEGTFVALALGATVPAILPPPVLRKDRPEEADAISATVIFMREQHPDWDFTSKGGDEGGKIANFLHGRRGSSRRRKIRPISGL
jgi:hypothetical protein